VPTLSKDSIEVTVEASGIAVGVVLIDGCVNSQSPKELLAEIEKAVKGISLQDPEGEARRVAVRNMLRHGRYKPTGRGKPASEYLVRAASEGNFPQINVLADINNLVSLVSKFPISIIDLELAAANTYQVRFGVEGESYVFNPSGQEMELQDLLLVASLDRPLANPVKDCQATKTSDKTTKALGFLYGPSSLASELHVATRWMADLIAEFTGANVSHWMQVNP